MSSRSPAAMLVVVSVLSGEAAPQPEVAPEPPVIRVETADRPLLSRLVDESGADTRPPEPGALAFVAELVGRVMKWIASALAPAGRYAGVLGAAFGRAAGVLVAIVAALLVFLLGRFVYRRMKRRPDVADAEVLVDEREERAKAPRSWSSDRWQEELGKRLDRADVAGSLEALWWWLARSILGSSVKESWTSGDLLANAGRPGLADPVRALERMMYGSRRPSLDEVRELARSLREQLA